MKLSDIKTFDKDNPTCEISIPYEDQPATVLKCTLKSVRHPDVEPLIDKTSDEQFASMLSGRKRSKGSASEKARKSDLSIASACVVDPVLYHNGEPVEDDPKWDEIIEYFPKYPALVREEAGQ